MSSREVIARLKADGWELVHIRGSHHQYKHPTKPGRVTVPHPKKDLPRGTLRSIYRQAGWQGKPE
jgi:predicted RNA binding protein YcfA (HicA-like mRNA interferase family)